MLLNRLVRTKFLDRRSDSLFVIGDGNSLNDFDFSEIEGFDVLSLSFAPMASAWPNNISGKLRMGLLTSPMWFLPYMPQVVGGGYWRNNANKIFLKRIKELEFDMLYVSKWSLCTYLFHRKVTAFKSPLRLNDEKLDWSIGGLSYALYLAQVMGYKSIKLVGCDYLSIPANAGHWFENSKQVPVKLDKYLYDHFHAINHISIEIWTNKGELLYERLIPRKIDKPNVRKHEMLENFRVAISSWNDYDI